ncbi:hypothetical protein EDB86DRAFT_2830254 [Lactarius hatsudake]|nr:hypothetical protein EDB86DRAFT_2830254 [Lactarius hatsudake]
MIPIVTIHICVTTACIVITIAIAMLTIPAAVPIPTAYATHPIVIAIGTTAARALAMSMVIVVVFMVVALLWHTGFDYGGGRGVVWVHMGWWITYNWGGDVGGWQPVTIVMGCNATVVVRQWEVLRSICHCTLPLAYPAGTQATVTPPEQAGLWSKPIFSSPAATAPESFKPPTSPTHAKASPCFPTLQAPSATSALSLWPSPPPTPHRMQRARAAMTWHTRPTTTLTRRMRVPAQDTPQRIKNCGQQGDIATTVATMARQHCHDGGDNGEATSPRWQQQQRGDIATTVVAATATMMATTTMTVGQRRRWRHDNGEVAAEGGGDGSRGMASFVYCYL